MGWSLMSTNEFGRASKILRRLVEIHRMISVDTPTSLSEVDLDYIYDEIKTIIHAERANDDVHVYLDKYMNARC